MPHGRERRAIWVLTSRRAQQLLKGLAATPLYRWDLDAPLDEQGWEMTLDTATPTGYLGVDTGWASEHGHSLLLYLEDSHLAMVTGVLGSYTPHATRSALVPVLVTIARTTANRSQPTVAWSSTPEPAGC